MNDTQGPCIYCLSSDGSFSAPEHVYPESLGNERIVLSPGTVCDECNHGILAQLDQYLIDFEPIALLRVHRVPKTKQGKGPKANFQNMRIERVDDDNIRLVAKDKTGGVRSRQKMGQGWVKLGFETRARPLRPVQLGRALYKVALGSIAFKQGPPAALEPRYDKARCFVREGGSFRNNLFIRTQWRPHSKVTTRYTSAYGGTLFTIDIYGASFAFNLEENPTLKLGPELEALGLECYPLESET